MNCDFIIQYRVDNELRDGINTQTQDFTDNKANGMFSLFVVFESYCPEVQKWRCKPVLVVFMISIVRSWNDIFWYKNEVVNQRINKVIWNISEEFRCIFPVFRGKNKANDNKDNGMFSVFCCIWVLVWSLCLILFGAEMIYFGPKFRLQTKE